DQWQRLSHTLTPYWLPAYAPQLNLIERVWRWLKSKIACHRWWNAMDQLPAATETLLAAVEVHFHTTNGPSFQVVQNFYHSA
ncbi:MAG: transposase, partial [Ktedonobacterales bacterium]|nr:transposase [Ktedonobacterales bacterium]